MNRVLLVVSSVAILLSASTSFFLFRYAQQWREQSAMLNDQITQLQVQNKALKENARDMQAALERHSGNISTLGDEVFGGPVERLSQIAKGEKLKSRITGLKTQLAVVESRGDDLSRLVLGGPGSGISLTNRLSSAESTLGKLDKEVFGGGIPFGSQPGLDDRVSDLARKLSYVR